jgi:hypothetical protein
VSYQRCGDLLCARDPTSTVAVRPADGAVRWHLDGVLVRQAGRRAALADQARPAGAMLVIDPADGRIAGRLERHTVLGRVAGDRTRLVLGLALPGRTLFTLLNLDTGDTQVVGSTPGQYDSCQASARYLACQATSSAAVHLWRIT